MKLSNVSLAIIFFLSFNIAFSADPNDTSSDDTLSVTSDIYTYVTSEFDDGDLLEEMESLKEEGARFFENPDDIDDITTEEALVKTYWGDLDVQQLLFLPLSLSNPNLIRELGDYGVALRQYPIFIILEHEPRQLSFKKRRRTQRFGNLVGLEFTPPSPHNNKDFEKIRDCISYEPHRKTIKVLGLGKLPFSQQEWSELYLKLNNLDNLQILNVSNQKHGIREIGKVIEASTQLKHLIFQNINLSTTWSDLPNLNQWPNSLKVLDFKGSKLPYSALKSLLEKNDLRFRLGSIWIMEGSDRQAAIALVDKIIIDPNNVTLEITNDNIETFVQTMMFVNFIGKKLKVLINNCDQNHTILSRIAGYNLSYELHGSPNISLFSNRENWKNLHKLLLQDGFTQQNGGFVGKEISRTSTLLKWHAQLLISYSKKVDSYVRSADLTIDQGTYEWSLNDLGIKSIMDASEFSFEKDRSTKHIGSYFKVTEASIEALKQLWPCLLCPDLNNYGVKGLYLEASPNNHHLMDKALQIFKNVDYSPWKLTKWFNCTALLYYPDSFGISGVYNLKNLMLRDFKYSDKSAGTIRNLFRPSLESIQLINGYDMKQGIGLKDQGLKILLDSRYYNKNLGNLTLQGQSIGDSGISNLVKIFSNIPNLHTLILSNNIINACGVDILSSNLFKLPILRYLSIEHNQMATRAHHNSNAINQIKQALLNLFKIASVQFPKGSKSSYSPTTLAIGGNMKYLNSGTPTYKAFQILFKLVDEARKINNFNFSFN